MQSQCGKVHHLTDESANRHAAELEELLGTRPDVYRCKKCKGLHVGYPRNAKLSKKGRRIRNYKKSMRNKKRRD